MIKIGIFDSGIGGFTILSSLLKTRKDVEIFYLADTKLKMTLTMMI